MIYSHCFFVFFPFKRYNDKKVRILFMKKKYLFLLPLLLMPLAACDMSGPANKGNDSDETSEAGLGEKFSYDKQEVANKLKTYGQTTGFDITAEIKTSNDEGNSVSTIEVAMKDNMVWLISEEGSYTGVQLNANGVTAFASEDGQEFETTELGAEELGGKTPEEFFDQYMETLTSWLYFADTYKSLGLTRVKEFTYVGRNVIEYSYHMSYGVASSTFKTYVDVELGITLYFFAEAIDGEGHDSEEFAVKSFLSGNQVSKPSIDRK